MARIKIPRFDYNQVHKAALDTALTLRRQGWVPARKCSDPRVCGVDAHPEIQRREFYTAVQRDNKLAATVPETWVRPISRDLEPIALRNAPRLPYTGSNPQIQMMREAADAALQGDPSRNATTVAQLQRRILELEGKLDIATGNQATRPGRYPAGAGMAPGRRIASQWKAAPVDVAERMSTYVNPLLPKRQLTRDQTAASLARTAARAPAGSAAAPRSTTANRTAPRPTAGPRAPLALAPAKTTSTAKPKPAPNSRTAGKPAAAAPVAKIANTVSSKIASLKKGLSKPVTELLDGAPNSKLYPQANVRPIARADGSATTTTRTTTGTTTKTTKKVPKVSKPPAPKKRVPKGGTNNKPKVSGGAPKASGGKKQDKQPKPPTPNNSGEGAPSNDDGTITQAMIDAQTNQEIANMNAAKDMIDAAEAAGLIDSAYAQLMRDQLDANITDRGGLSAEDGEQVLANLDAALSGDDDGQPGIPIPEDTDPDTVGNADTPNADTLQANYDAAFNDGSLDRATYEALTNDLGAAVEDGGGDISDEDRDQLADDFADITEATNEQNEGDQEEQDPEDDGLETVDEVEEDDTEDEEADDGSDGSNEGDYDEEDYG